jgi:LmbE family N-acetylglucosaminyl deacetylase
MKEFDLDPSISWLFVFAHPDDELAIAAWIRRLTSVGSSVTISWFHADGCRKEEAKMAAKAMGVAEENCSFGRFGDGLFLKHINDIQIEAKRALESCHPDRVVCAAFEQGHLDHDSLRYAIEQVWEGPTLEFPEYWPYTPRVATMNRFTCNDEECVIELSGEEQRRKLEMAKMYPSTEIWRNLFWYEVWSALRFNRANLVKTERLRWSPKHDFSKPSVPERYKSRVLKSREWRDWMAAMARIDNPD